jgi:hypothetical protein
MKEGGGREASALFSFRFIYSSLSRRCRRDMTCFALEPVGSNATSGALALA